MSGRRFGLGRLFKIETSGAVTAWAAKWTDAQGRRHRKLLSTDRRVAERLLTKIIRDRDLALGGLGAEESQDQLLAGLVTGYMDDLATFRRPTYVRVVRLYLGAIMTAFGPIRVR